MSLCCECCVLSGRDLCVRGRYLVQRSPTECGVSLCVIYKPRELGGPGPRWAVAPEGKKGHNSTALFPQRKSLGH
jgi:hypothetical protein